MAASSVAMDLKQDMSEQFVVDNETVTVVFVDPKLAKELECTVCKNVLAMTQAVILPGEGIVCGCTFCQDCVSKFRDKHCPIDKHPFSTTVPDTTRRRAVYNLRVHCPWGCASELAFSKIGVHSCGERPVACDFADFGCQTRPKKKDAEHHKTNDIATHLALVTKDARIQKEKVKALENRLGPDEIKFSHFSISSNGDALRINKDGHHVAEFTDGRDRLRIFQNVDGQTPYFFMNNEGEFGIFDAQGRYVCYKKMGHTDQL